MSHAERVLLASDIQEHGIDRRCRRDEQPIVARPTKGQVRNHFRHLNFPDELTFGRMALYAIPCADPEIARNIKAKTIRNARRYIGEDAGIYQSVTVNVKLPDMMRGAAVGEEAGVRNIKTLLVKREGEPVRHGEIIGNDGDCSRAGIDPVDAAARLLLQTLAPDIV